MLHLKYMLTIFSKIINYFMEILVKKYFLQKTLVTFDLGQKT